MNPNLLPREQVAERLAVSTRVLLAYERRGLVRAIEEGGIEGYPPSEVRRLWTVVSLHRDAGINLAGIEAILQLQGKLDRVCRHLQELAEHLDEVIERHGLDED